MGLLSPANQNGYEDGGGEGKKTIGETNKRTEEARKQGMRYFCERGSFPFEHFIACSVQQCGLTFCSTEEMRCSHGQSELLM